jgi:hypothetical protein
MQMGPSAEDDESLDATAVVEAYIQRYINRRPCRTSLLGGNEWVLEILSGHPMRCFQNFRVAPDVFMRIVEIVRSRVSQSCRSLVSIEERLAMFLFIVGQNASNRNTQERFQHSGETVSRYMVRHFRIGGLTCFVGISWKW